MDDLLTCSVCCEQYQETLRHPVVLPRCGHSFCRPCVAFLVKNGCVICPSCRMDQRVETAEHLPTEFSLLAITNAQQVTKAETCQRHNVKLSFWCRSCREPACGECLFEDHPTYSHTVIKSSSYITEMKEAVTDISNKFIDALDLRERWYHGQVFKCLKTINDNVRTLSVLRRDVEDARELMKGASLVEGIGPTTQLSEASKCLGIKWNLRDCLLTLERTATTDVKAAMENKVAKEHKAAKEEKEKDETETKSQDNAVDSAEVKSEGDEKMEKDTTEKDNGIAEKEKNIDEMENLTEEEKKKRKKIMRLKEKLAAASAAAEKLEAEKTLSVKEKREKEKEEKEKANKEKEQNNNDISEKDLTMAAAKTKALARKYEPVARELSVSPDRDTSAKINKPKSTENKEIEQKISKKDSDANITEGTATDATTCVQTTQIPAVQQPADTIVKSIDALPDLEAKKQAKLLAKQEAIASGIRKPRGRLARQALKRSQTMNFVGPDNKTEACTTMGDQSDNIKGLDLELSKANKNNELEADNKDIEEQGSSSGETKEAEQESTAEKNGGQEKDQTGILEGATGSTETSGEGKFFEMEPEEKERITTELMEVPSLTMVVEGIGGRLAYATWEQRGLHVYCHQYQELPYDFLIKSAVLLSLTPTKNPVVFLDIGSETKALGRVYITLWGHLRRAMNFLHLCLGDRGPSFRNTLFLEVLNPDSPGERIKGGDYEYNDGRGGEGLLDDLEYHEGNAMRMEAGMVTAGGAHNAQQDSQFFICTEDDYDRKFMCPFGRVESGLVTIKETIWMAVTKEMWIRDCGLVIDVPKI